MSYQHVDIARIPDLARDLGVDISACLRFVDDFLQSWQARQARVAHGVGSPVVDDALAALLTISATSAMVGARTLSAVARELHAEVCQVGTVPARGADHLARIGAASCDELRHSVDGWRLLRVS